MAMNRRKWIASTSSGIFGALGAGALARGAPGAEVPPGGRPPSGLAITAVRVTPIALPDPPILASSGCHGPYFLRNLIEIETEAGITGIGETYGGEEVTAALERSRGLLVGQSAFAYGKFAAEVSKLGTAAYAGVELACLDAAGRATGRRLSELTTRPCSRTRASQTGEGGAIARSIPGARSALPERWRRWPGSSIAGGASRATS